MEESKDYKEEKIDEPHSISINSNDTNINKFYEQVEEMIAQELTKVKSVHNSMILNYEQQIKNADNVLEQLKLRHSELLKQKEEKREAIEAVFSSLAIFNN